MADTSTRNALEEVTRRWIALWCVPVAWDRFRALHADDFEDRASAGRGTSVEAFASGLAQLVEAFPDLETRTEDLVVDEARSRVAVRWRATGTNRARYLGVGPTGKRVVITGIEIVEIAGGRIRRRWGEWDIGDHLGASPSLRPIGRVRSPLTSRQEAPLQGGEGAPEAWLELNEDVHDALDGIEPGQEMIVLTWLHQGRREVLKVHPRGDLSVPLHGVFATRSPDRPNPIGLHRVRVVEVAGNALKVVPLEAIDGTPVIDLKPVLAVGDG